MTYVKSRRTHLLGTDERAVIGVCVCVWGGGDRNGKSSDSRIQVMSSFNLKKNVCHSLISPWMNVHGRNGGEVNNSATDGVGQDPANNGRVTIASSLGVINRMHGRPGQEILRTLTAASCAGR